MEPSCIFCKIASGELPSFRVYENEKTLAFLDINPVNKGHTLVIPKHHSKNIFEISKEDWSASMETVRIVSSALEHSLSANGVNLIMNNREHAGQLVDHAHVHVIPRFAGDGLRGWPQRSYKEDEAEETLQKIKSAL